jgi:hypothetical protein
MAAIHLSCNNKTGNTSTQREGKAMWFIKYKQGTSLRRSAYRWLTVALITCSLCVSVTILAIQLIHNKCVVGDDKIPTQNHEPIKDEEARASKALIILDGAMNLQQGPSAYGTFYVSYGLMAEYPPSNVIQQISSKLNDLHWAPLKEDWLNPGIPSSHVRGWTEFLDDNRGALQHVHQWLAQWKDPSGNIVSYSLRYSYKEGGPSDLKSLWVNGIWNPDTYVKMRSAEKSAEKIEKTDK